MGSAAGGLGGTLAGAGIGTAIAPGFGTVAGAAVGGAAGGAIAQNFGQKNSSSQLNLIPASQNEQNYFGLQNQQFGNLQTYLNNSGPTQADYAAGVQSTRALGNQYSDYAASGGLPSSTDVNQSNAYAKNLYAASQTSLNQLFNDQTVAENRQAAQLGRPINDPVLQAKLQTGFLRQQASLNAEQLGTANQIALQLPQQRLQLASQAANIQNGLGNQALQNQQYLLGLGGQLGNQERNFRLASAGGSQVSSQGGSLGDTLTGVLSGAGTGLKIASYFGGGSGGGSNLLNSGQIQSADQLYNSGVQQASNQFSTASNAGSGFGFSGYGGGSNYSLFPT